MTGYVGVFASCMPNPTQIVTSVIPNSAEEDEWGMEKSGVLHICGNNPKNSASYTR